jgi:hypothetical protein
MNESPGDLHAQAEEFGQETAGLLSVALPGLPVPSVEILGRDDRFIVRASASGNSKGLPLYVK